LGKGGLQSTTKILLAKDGLIQAGSEEARWLDSPEIVNCGSGERTEDEIIQKLQTVRPLADMCLKDLREYLQRAFKCREGYRQRIKQAREKRGKREEKKEAERIKENRKRQK
jgi:hypothetical protein